MERLQQPKAEQKTGLPRALLAAGFMIIMLGIGVGAATDGSAWAKYIALAGVATIGVSIVFTVVEKVTGTLRGTSQPAV